MIKSGYPNFKKGDRVCWLLWIEKRPNVMEGYVTGVEPARTMLGPTLTIQAANGGCYSVLAGLTSVKIISAIESLGRLVDE